MSNRPVGCINLNRVASVERIRVPGRAFSLLVAFVVILPLSRAQIPSPSPQMIEDIQLKPARRDGKWGYIDASGRVLILAQFSSASEFSEGVAAVELNKRFGYINTDGHVVIPIKYVGAAPFRNGFAWVVTGNALAPLGKGEYGIALFGRVTYVDHSGREIVHPFMAESVSNFAEGLAAVRPGKIFGGCSAKAGYLNTRGKWAIKPQFDEAHDFSDGLAAVNRGGKCQMGGRWGYIDRDGRIAIPFKYGFAGQFKNGRACVQEAGDWQLIDARGNGIPVNRDACLR